MRSIFTKATKTIPAHLKNIEEPKDKYSYFLRIIDDVLDHRPNYNNFHFLENEYNKLKEQGHEVVVSDGYHTFRFEAPGYDVKDVGISIDGDYLIINAKKAVPEHLNSSFDNYSFNTKVPLPKVVDKTKITARLSNGILSVEVPVTKTEKSKVIKIPIIGG